jgi:hypothetical protein
MGPVMDRRYFTPPQMPFVNSAVGLRGCAVLSLIATAHSRTHL